jgi:3-methyl-2-oxobutanoate hydroxymethyltransferase
VSIDTLSQLRASHLPITMLTAYDYPTARLLSACPSVDVTLVGDSLAQVCLGYPSTTSLRLDEMIHHAKAVRRGTSHPLLVADMPFGSYHVSAEEGVRNAVRLVQEAGVEAVKLEGGGSDIVHRVRRLTSVGIAVMGHVGLLPQRHAALSGYHVQGKSASSAREIVRASLALQDAGAFALVIEAVPAPLASYITARLTIPTIGIGAGPGTSGQVLVWDDVMGTWGGHKAKFVRRFADVKSEAEKGISGFAEAVRAGTFPSEAESYSMDEAEWETFSKMQRDEAGDQEKERT